MKLVSVEIKRCLKNPLFWITAILLFLFVNSQFTGDTSKWTVEKPIEGQESYGSIATEDMNIVRSESLATLLLEYSNNSYTTYPYGFYRGIELNETKNVNMQKLLSALTGATIQDIESLQRVPVEEKYSNEDTKNTFTQQMSKIMVSSEVNSITDDNYLDLMEKADQLLGGGSFYSKKLIVSHFGNRPKTYEEALVEYDAIINRDKITGAFARLFCDYAGIAVALLPIFLSVALWYQDKRSNCSDILYSKMSSSAKIVLSRFLAMVILLTTVILLIATFYNIKIIKANGIENVDLFAFYRYALLWLTPSLIVVLSVGTFTTILTNSPLGILVMFIWWFIGLFGGVDDIYGGYGYQLVLRHNIIGNTDVYFNNLGQVLLNRGIYTAISIILIILSIKVYRIKREGRIFQNENNRKDYKERG